MRVSIAILLALALAGCADSPYNHAGGPSVIPPLGAPTIAGRWAGQISLTVDGQRITAPVRVRLTQEGSAASGTWNAIGQEVSGVFEATVSGPRNAQTLTGSMTWLSDAATPGVRCTGTATAAGTSRDGFLQVTVPTFQIAPCAALTNVVWTLELL